ncbi:M56 family metallopeptidase [Alloiococcus sp. CFN-8]|uniref:M56 family metallopeptidase n=1 Tax=Alloiococcus sp. CFN-8 TaxID=3416081 RepID=UPI003CF3E649
MIWFRIAWALFLTIMVNVAFRRSWGWEHGKPASYMSLKEEEDCKETVIWMSPLILPFMMIGFLVLFIIFEGGKAGLFRFLGLSLDIVVTFSFYYIILLALLPVLRKYFSARACATLWIIPVFLLYQAHVMYQSGYTPFLVIYIPAVVLRWFPYIWLLGFLTVFLSKIAQHIIFRHRIMSSAWNIEDEELLAIWNEELDRANYIKPVRLVFSKNALSPLSMGRTKRSQVTVMPDKEFSPEELHFIFRHEIRHLQRCDVDTKIFLAFCSALCWFNPLVWMAIRKASEDLELSCDEIVLEEADSSTRRRYAELLLQTASEGQGFTTCLSAAASSMRYRLKNVITSHKRWTGTILVSTAVFLCTMAYGTVAVSSNRSTIGDALSYLYASEGRIESVYYRDNYNYYDSNTKKLNPEKLYKYITSLEVEELNSANDLVYDSLPYISFYIKVNDEDIIISIEDKKMDIRKIFGKDKKYYILHSDIDWEYIKSVLEID